MRPKTFFAALAGVVFAVAPLAAGLQAQTLDPAKTFKVQNGASPWYDRVGTWELADLPASLANGAVDLPQQNCGSRGIVTPGGAASLLIGVSQKDLPAFSSQYPAARATEDVFSVRNPQGGNPIPYTALSLPKAGPEIKPQGMQAGLILLRVDPPAPAATPTASSGTAAVGDARQGAVVPVAFAVPGSPEKFDVYLLMGQSNMLGRDTSKLAEQIDNPRIGAMDGNGKWTVAREPMAGGSGTGPGLSFAAEMLKNVPADTKIGLVPCAVGGTRLARWVKGGDLYERAVARAKAAMKQGTLKGVLWHQGESDTNKDDAPTYEVRLAKMIADLRADVGRPDLPVVVGKLGPFVEPKNPFVASVNDSLAKVAATVPHVGLADSVGLTDKGDHLHFNAPSQIEFGKRYAQAMAKQQEARVRKRD